MEELHADGLATHGGPESCAAPRKGRGEALTGVRAGRAIEPRKAEDRGAHTLLKAEGNTAGSVIRELSGAPRGRRTMACAEPSCARAGRSRACPSVWSAGGPPGERCGGNPRMDGRGKSDQFVLPASLPNEARAEEAGEERNRVMGSTGGETRPGRSAGPGVSSGLDRVREGARKDKDARFTALLHHVSFHRLVLAFDGLKKDAAPGPTGELAGVRRELAGEPAGPALPGAVGEVPGCALLTELGREFSSSSGRWLFPAIRSRLVMCRW
jgi:RNA-directed DNA polymerase